MLKMACRWMETAAHERFACVVGPLAGRRPYHRSGLSPAPSAPILLGLTPDRRRFRVLHLEPVGRSARAVARAEPLRDDALEPHLAGVAEHDVAVVMLKMLVELQARPDLAQHGGERRLAHLERLTPQVSAVQLEQVEGEEEHGGVRAPVAQPVEARHAIVVAGDRLAVDQARAQLLPGGPLLGPVAPRPARRVPRLPWPIAPSGGPPVRVHP
jgi:hypothetical protein